MAKKYAITIALEIDEEEFSVADEVAQNFCNTAFEEVTGLTKPPGLSIQGAGVARYADQ
jgi:hypothetical protein